MPIKPIQYVTSLASSANTRFRRTFTPENVTPQILESLRMFSKEARENAEESVKRFPQYDREQLSMEWEPKTPITMGASYFTRERLWSHGPKYDYVEITDGANCVIVNSETGVIGYIRKKSRFTTATTLLKRMSNVMEHWQTSTSA